MEQWDIYDENKQKTGRTMNRNDWNMQPGDFHLTVLGVLRRPDGTYLITRRRMDKEWAPGCWEVPGGGVRAGESAEDAVKREILEETGVDVSNADGGYVFSYKRVNPEEKNNYFVDIFRYTMDIPDSAVHTQEREVMEYAFATLEQIQEYTLFSCTTTASSRYLPTNFYIHNNNHTKKGQDDDCMPSCPFLSIYKISAKIALDTRHPFGVNATRSFRNSTNPPAA